MSGDGIGSLKFQLGLLTSGFRANHPLKFCPVCMQEDVRNSSTPYWHWSHQQPGVWICPVHAQLLEESTLKSTGVQRFQWALPNCESLSPSFFASRSYDKEALISLAQISIQLASMAGDVYFEPDKVCLTYRRALSEMNLASADGLRLKTAEVGKVFIEHVNKLAINDFLFKSEVVDQASAAAIIARWLHAARSRLHPLKHGILISCLFDNFGDFVECYRANLTQSTDQIAHLVEPVFEIPNSDEKEFFLQLIENGRSVSGAAKELGIDPVTGMAWAAKQGIATKKRPKILTEVVKNKMIAALKLGNSKPRVAAIASVSISSVTRLLRTEVDLQKQWHEALIRNAQNQNRQQWLNLLDANPCLGGKSMRLLDPATYAWLYRNDRTWLQGHSIKISRANEKKTPRIDWVERDTKLAAEVLALGLKLFNANPGKKIKLWMLYQLIPELKAKLNRLNLLPMTKHAVSTVIGKM
jgi:hypothetical protein